MSTNQVYSALGVLKFKDVYNLFLLKFFQSIRQNDLDSFNKFFAPLTARHGINTRRRMILPAVRLEIERNSTIFRIARLYNTLPGELTENLHPSTVKKKYMKLLLGRYLDT